MHGRFRASLCAFVVSWLVPTLVPAAAPTLQYLTYLGGNGLDHVNAVAADPEGNIVVAGYTTSTNFPGASGELPTGVSLFVAKLDATGKSLRFTTILAHASVSSSVAIIDYVTSVVIDVDGSIYVTGSTNMTRLQVTGNAWSKTGQGGFIAKLDPAGRIVYATSLPFGIVVSRLQLRNGVLYGAGTLSDPTFLGTPGAAQRDFAGGYGDLFVLAMNADGSAPLYLTAVGSSGADTLYDFVLDNSGGIILSASSDSPAFPTTADALFPANLSPGNAASVLVRLDSTLSHVTYATWLPRNVAFLAVTPDGNYVITGELLDDRLTAGAPLNNITLAPGATPAVITKMSSASNRPIWSTALRLNGGAYFRGIAADSQGNLIWTNSTSGFSGGSISTYGNSAIIELSADGTRLLYDSRMPADAVLFAPEPSGTIILAGYTTSTLLPVTPDALQPHRDPAPPGDSRNPQNFDDGYAGRIDLSSFTSGNFFLAPQNASVTWRIGEPIPAPTVVPVQFGGNPAATLSVTASSRLTATYLSGDSPAVSITAVPSQTVAGTFPETVTVQIAGKPNTVVALPISLTVKPAVSFDVATTQVEIHIRQGQDVVPVKVDITPHFGNEYFYFKADSSDRSWLFPYVDSGSGRPQLSINVGIKPPGVYSGTVTLTLDGLQNGTRTVAVRYTVDPPATIQLSTYHLSLHVIKGQPFHPVTVDVTGSVPGVKFNLFVGTSYSFMNIRQTAQATPAQIVINADTSAAIVGYSSWRFSVTGEDGKQLVVDYDLDVSSGAALDVSPAAIDLQWIRGMPGPAAQFVSFTTLAPGNVQWSADKPWVFPHEDSGPAPRGVYFSFDTSLPEGVYQATVTATAAGATKTLPITWRLYDLPRLAFSVSQLTFRYRIGGPLPPAQPIKISTPTLQQPYVSVGATPGYLKVDPAYGNTPITLNVTVDPTGIPAGTYNTNLTIFPQFPGLMQSVQIPVTFIVDPDPNAPNATVAQVTDAASYLPGSVAPGELLVIFGAGLGPATLVQAPSTDSRFPTTLAGTTVYFDGTPAPILYASSTQLAVVAPFGIAGRPALTVDLSGKRTPSLPLNFSATNPGLFTANASGSGLAAALNVAADSSVTVHGSNAPAARGGILTLYATGCGATAPILADGAIVAAPLPVLNNRVTVLIGGQPAPVLYAGPAPGMIAGVTQINVRVPETAASGLNSILIVSGEIPSQPGVTIAVQ